jgi:hypothetical protein
MAIDEKLYRRRMAFAALGILATNASVVALALWLFPQHQVAALLMGFMCGLVWLGYDPNQRAN